MMEYTIIMNDSVIALEGRVNAMIQKGWRPVGGLALMCDLHMVAVAQAMIKKPSISQAETEPTKEGPTL